MSEMLLTLRINAEGNIVGVVDEAGKASQRFGTEAKRAGDTASRGFDEGRKSAGNMRVELAKNTSAARGLARELGGVAAGFISVAGVSRLIRTAVDNTIRQEQAMAQLEARIKSTGGAAGFTAQEMAGMAAELQKLTTFGDEAVMEMQGVLLTFTQVRGEIVERATPAILDLATAMRMDLQSAALQVGKALNDPLLGLTALSRAGIQFSDDQKATIQALVETGQVAEAQKVILGELERQLGGAAEAARGTFGGALQALRNTLGDLLEGGSGLGTAADAIERINQKLSDPAVKQGIDELVGGIINLTVAVGEGLGVVVQTTAAGLQLLAEHQDLVKITAVALIGIYASRFIPVLGAKKLLWSANTREVVAYQLALARMAGVSNAAAAGQVALSLASRSVAAAMALAGGPLGIAVGLVGAIAFHAYQAAAAKRQLSENIAAATTTLEQYNNARARGQQATLQDIDFEHRHAEALERVLRLRRILAHPNAELFHGPRGFAQLTKELAEAEDALTSLETQAKRALGNIGRDIVGPFLAQFREIGQTVQNEGRIVNAVATNDLNAFTEKLAEQTTKLQDQQIELTKGTRALLEYKVAQLEANGASAESIEAARQAIAEHERERAALDAIVESRKAQAQALEQLRGLNEREEEGRKKDLIAQEEAVKAAKALVAGLKQEAAQVRMTRGEIAKLAAERQLEVLAMEAGAQMTPERLAQLRAEAFAAIDLRENLEGNAESALALESILRRYDDIGLGGLIKDIERVRRELERVSDESSDAFDPDRVRELEAALGQMNAQMAVKTVGGFKALIGAAQTFTKEGSKSFKAMEKGMAALQILQDIIALKAAVASVLSQGQSPPPASFAAMAAMAAAVAPLLASIGLSLSSFGGGGGFTNTAALRQERQGTGTVLGDFDAKSESIARAVEITADATSQLPGLSRAQLRALQQLNSSIGAATTMLARGAGSASFTDLPAAGRFSDVLPGALGSVFRDPLNLLGGSSRITDQGIVIFGGALTEMLENIAVGAYQEVQTRRWRFGSRRPSEEVVGVSDDLATQFELIIQSIVETVREGALALGMLPAEVQEALAAFRVAEIRISLMDLTAEEQQAELAAVFSSLFDGLAAHVVPFLPQFQRVGEGLAETLIRVATGVQVTQEAVARLGFSLDETDPERFAQISESLIELTGGLDEFINGMLSFVDKFASEEHKFRVAQDSLISAFEQYGLTVPESRDAMWDLMESLDATTEQGREQIAILLQLADVSHAYYSELERQADRLRAYADIVVDLNRNLATQGLTDFQSQLFDNRLALRQTIDAMHRAARQAGLQAAREEDLARAHALAAAAAARAIQQLTFAGQDLVAQIFGTPLDTINEEIARLEADSRGSIQRIGDTFQQAMRDGAAAADSLLLGDTSPLTSRQRLDEAMRQFHAAVARGDLDAAQRLADTTLRISQDRFGGTQRHVEIFGQIESMLRGLTDRVGGTGGGAPESVGEQVSSALREAYARRDELLTEQRERERVAQGHTLAQMIADLSRAGSITFAEAAERMGTTLEDLAGILGMDEDALEDFIASLVVDPEALADSIHDMRDALVEELQLLRAAVERKPIRDDLDISKPPAPGPDQPGPGPIGGPGPGGPGDRTFDPIIPFYREQIDVIGKVQGEVADLRRDFEDARDLLRAIAQNTEQNVGKTGEVARAVRDGYSPERRSVRTPG